MLECVWL